MTSIMRCEPLGRLSAGPVRGGDFDRVFDRFFQAWPTFWQGLEARRGFDVQEKDDAIIVRTEAPGFEVEDFDLQIHGDVLTIKAARKESEEKDEGFGQWRQSEFERAITLPTEIDADKVEARYKNGVLTIHIPKTPEAKPKRVAVKA